MFTAIDELEKVTAGDVQRVAKQYLVPENRTVAYTVAPASSASNASKGESK
jgi:predicted Zn-dependent peptidase